MSIQSVVADKKLYFLQNGYQSYEIKVVEPDYYQKNYEDRCLALQTTDPQHLCKCIIMENTSFQLQYENKYYKKYYCIIIQYVTKMNVMKLEKNLKDLYNQNNQQQIGNKQIHLRLVNEDVSAQLTGYQYNSVEPFQLKTPMTVIFSDNVSKLKYFWLGGGHVDVKVRVSTQEFLTKWNQSELQIIEII